MNDCVFSNVSSDSSQRVELSRTFQVSRVVSLMLHPSALIVTETRFVIFDKVFKSIFWSFFFYFMYRLTSLCLYLPVFNPAWWKSSAWHVTTTAPAQMPKIWYSCPSLAIISAFSCFSPLRFVIMVRKWFKFVLTLQPPVLWYCWGGWIHLREILPITCFPAEKYSLGVFQRHSRYSLTLIDVLKMSCSRTPSRAHGCVVSRLLLHLK